MGALSMSTRQHGEATIIELDGAASMSEIDAFSRQTDRLAAARPKLLVLDFSRLTFLASLAIGQVVALSKSVKMHGGRVVIAAPTPDVLSVVQRCNLGAIVPVFATVEEALAPG